MKDKIILSVATAILSYDGIKKIKDGETYVPLDDKAVMQVYQNDPLLHRAVNSSAFFILEWTLHINGICYCNIDKPVEATVCNKCRGLASLRINGG